MHDAVLPIFKDDQLYQRAGLLLSILLLSLALSRALKLLSGTESAIRRALAKVAAVLFGAALSLGCVASCAGHRTNGRGAAAEPEPGLVASHFDHLGCVASVTAVRSEHSLRAAVCGRPRLACLISCLFVHASGCSFAQQS
eukprot:6191768-Pleurochrysis_carterae.AAC.2